MFEVEIKAELTKRDLNESLAKFIKIEKVEDIAAAIDELAGMIPTKPKTLAEIMADAELKKQFDLELLREGDRRVEQAKKKLQKPADPQPGDPALDPIEKKITEMVGPMFAELKTLISDQQKLTAVGNRRNAALDALKKEGIAPGLIKFINLDVDTVTEQVAELKTQLVSMAQDSNNTLLSALVKPGTGKSGELNVSEAAIKQVALSRNNEAVGGDFAVPKQFAPPPN